MAVLEEISPGRYKINWDEAPVIKFGNNGNVYTVPNGSAITLKPGTVVNPPVSVFEKIIGFVKGNWQLSVLGIIAIIVLLKE